MNRRLVCSSTIGPMSNEFHDVRQLIIYAGQFIWDSSNMRWPPFYLHLTRHRAILMHKLHPLLHIASRIELRLPPPPRPFVPLSLTPVLPHQTLFFFVLYTSSCSKTKVSQKNFYFNIKKVLQLNMTE